MRIGLHDAEQEYMKHKTFPNYALMKISAYHKARGDSVEWWSPMCHYDRVYSSKVFDFTPENLYLPPDTIRGGTGYDDIPLNQKLPPEIDAAFPDYSIYPECDYAIGYLTRGCPNHCPWCVVPEKEGGIKPYREWKQVVRPDTNKLVLMDNNILASEYGVSQLESMIGSGYAIDLNQGMDARLVNDRIAGILARLTWIRFIRFSCDQIPQIEAIERAAELLGNHGKKPYNLFIYLLVTEDVENAAYLYAVAGFVAVAAEVRRVCGDRPVAFVGVLIRAATAKGLSTGFTTPGELAGAGTGRPGCAVGLAGHQTTTLSTAPATGTQNEAISAALAISTFIRSNITERENAGYFREFMG